MKPPVYTITDFKIRSDKLGSARRRMRDVERVARSKPGVLQYHFLQDMEDPTVFTGYGIFASARDLESYVAEMKDASDNDPDLHSMLDPDHPFSLRTLDRI